MARTAISSKDEPISVEKSAEMDRLRRMRDAEAIKATWAGKKWADLKKAERDDLLKAMAIHFGFIDS